MIKKIYRFLKNLNRNAQQFSEFFTEFNNDRKNAKVNLGQIQARMNASFHNPKTLHEVEFQVFSQWGDDGIIQYLISNIELPNKTFIEFGVEDYREANTRFLLVNNNFSGLVIDGELKNIEKILKDEVSWQFDLHSVHKFITKDNINQTIEDFLAKGYNREIGILSVDIDGNDYWVLDSINVINPVILIVEYNAVFGPTNKWTIPYSENFYGINEHSSRNYWGASLNAFCHIAEKKGYTLIGCNSNGNNAYFVRNDKIGRFTPLTSEQAFVDSKFRLSLDKNGDWLIGKARLQSISGLEVFDIDQNKVIVIKSDKIE
jgi:hypothetical protein